MELKLEISSEDFRDPTMRQAIASMFGILARSGHLPETMASPAIIDQAIPPTPSLVLEAPVEAAPIVEAVPEPTLTAVEPTISQTGAKAKTRPKSKKKRRSPIPASQVPSATPTDISVETVLAGITHPKTKALVDILRSRGTVSISNLFEDHSEELELEGKTRAAISGTLKAVRQHFVKAGLDSPIQLKTRPADGERIYVWAPPRHT